jgi:hypothetical protein
MQPASSPKPRQKPKILTAHRHIFSVNALHAHLNRNAAVGQKENEKLCEYQNPPFEISKLPGNAPVQICHHFVTFVTKLNRINC